MSSMRILVFLLVLIGFVTPSARADQSDPRLERLFNQLASVRTPPEADMIISQIDAIWSDSGSDTVDLLMSRAEGASEAQDFDTAMKLLDVVAEMKANFAEVWYRRAELFLQMDSQQEAAADLTKAVNLEPRQFRAHALLGRLADNAGNKAAALLAYRKAVALNPMLEAVNKRAGEISFQEKRQPPI